jgi:uncharacterized protein (DUF2249 family)
MISGDTTVARLLDEHPELTEVLASYHPHFEQFRDQHRRRLMATRLTLDQAARIAGVPTDDLLAMLRRAAGEASPPAPEERERDTAAAVRAESAGASRPEVPVARQVHLDVRDGIRRGEEPFARIMAAVRGLGPTEVLVLRVPFEPIPLYDALGKRGFAHWTERHGPDDWSVWFHRSDAGEPGARTGARTSPRAGEGTFTLDVRGLEPPQPMVRILEALERLRAGETLEVLHERRPMFLYPQLDERGFLHETDEPAPGLVRIVIRAGGGTA